MNKGLNSFRTFAFLAVFFFHFDLLGIGYLGVEAFFVLSGFLITKILVEMKRDNTPKDFFIHFYGRRVLRIFPLYYFYLFGMIGLALLAKQFIKINDPHAIDNFLDQIPWALTYTFNFFHASKFFSHTPLLTHFWSLAVEEQFYLIWPFAVFLINKKNLKTFLLIVIVTGPLIRYIIGFIVDSNYSVYILTAKDIVVTVLPFSHLDAFAIGGYFALYRKNTKSAYIWAYAVVLIAFGLITSWKSLGNINLYSLGYHPFMLDSYKYIWGYSAFNILFALILSNLKDHRFLPVIFENRWLDYLGRISYGLYVYHFPAIYITMSVFDFLPKLFQVPIALVITIFISVLSYEYFEKRLLGMKDRFFPR